MLLPDNKTSFWLVLIIKYSVSSYFNSAVFFKASLMAIIMLKYAIVWFTKYSFYVPLNGYHKN